MFDGTIDLPTSLEEFAMIGVCALLAAVALGQPPAPPGPATLGLGDIIQGIAKNQELWRAQKGWVIRYTHSRERIDPPPGSLVLYGDNQVVNARKGPWAFLSEDQSMSGASGHAEGRRTWGLWKENQYTERNRLDLTIRYRPIDFEQAILLLVARERETVFFVEANRPHRRFRIRDKHSFGFARTQLARES